MNGAHRAAEHHAPARQCFMLCVSQRGRRHERDAEKPVVALSVWFATHVHECDLELGVELGVNGLGDLVDTRRRGARATRDEGALAFTEGREGPEGRAD